MATIAASAQATTLYDPALRFRVLRTEHFVIYFHQGEAALAGRLAVIAEETWQALRQPLGVAPPRRTHVVLADQTDLANGWATPLPYDTIMVTAVWPLGSEFIGATDDWLRLVFTHEFTHIVHLDRSEGWARVVRGIFGRMEIAFPNLFLPTWQIEGLATYEESVITGGGRLHAGDFGAVLNEAARNRALEPLDRVNGGLTDWPIGNAPYAYGLSFHRYLADRFGADRLAELADATARRVPYTGSRAFKRVYGQSLGALWRDYHASLATAALPPVVDVGPTRLTRHGFSVSGPRFDRFTCPTCPAEILYSVRTPHGFPALNRVKLDGSAPRQLTRRYLGLTTAIGHEELFFDQQELRRNVGLYSDIYVMTRESGRIRQLTSEARLLDPDLSADGRTLVCVQDRPGQRDLVLVRLPPSRAKRASASLAEAFGKGGKPDTTGAAPKPDTPGITSVASGSSGTSVASGSGRTNLTIETLLSEPETQFNAPRWSPDGRSIAVERHRRGALSEVVLVDIGTRSVRVVGSIPRGRVVTPAWRPDGGAIVAAVAPEDQTFNLFELALDGTAAPRQLTRTTGGATWPDISPDGKTIVFVGYTVDGFDLFTMPYPARSTPDRADTPLATTPQRSAGTERVAPQTTTAPVTTDYSPWPTLAPASWTPVIETGSSQIRVGAATGGFDVLGYHSYAGAATWLISAPADAATPAPASPDWNLYYAYDRWRPTFWAGASNETSFFSGPPGEAGTPTSATLRERELLAGMLLPIRHVRVSHTALLSVVAATGDYALASGPASRDRTALRGAWATTSAHTYGYSVSPEGGVAAGATAERVARALGSTADATAFTGDLRAYLPGIARHHVVALRVAGGISTGDASVRRVFHLGGAGPDGTVIGFARDAVSLLRGFDRDTFAGSHVALMNVDYRWPIARPQRGAGTWPLFVHTVHAAVFADAGHAWTRTFRAAAIKTSAGAELSTNIVAGYFFPFTATVGAAWGHDGSGTVRGGATVFVRVGRAF